jgi:putative membrane protein
MTPSSQRLHPISVLFLAVGSLRGILLPAAVVLITARGGTWEIWALWLSLPMAGVAIFRYFTTRYAFADDELMVRSGLLFRNERHIRYSRIQNIETVQNPLHRAFGVAEVRVETAGGTEQEARLQVLSLAAVDEMRKHVFEGKQRSAARGELAAPAGLDGETAAGGAETGPPRLQTRGGEATGPAVVATETPRVLVRLGLRDLVIFGLAQNRGGLVIAAALGVLWEADILDLDSGNSASMRRLIRVAAASGWFSTWDIAVMATLVGLFVAFLVVVRVLSVGWAIVRLYNFTLTRTGDELRTSCGLLTKVRGVVPMRRIQLVTSRQAPLQRLFDRVEVRVQTAGGDKDASPSREWLAPMLRRDAVDALLAEIVPGPGFDQLQWMPVDRRAAWRELRTSLRVIAVPALAGVWFAPALTIAIAAVAIVVAFLASRGRARAFGYALADDRVAWRSGWLWRSTSLARYSKVQVVSLGESPFDRRWKMASVSADTAGGGSHRITIPYLPVAEAHALFETLGARVNETAFRW